MPKKKRTSRREVREIKSSYLWTHEMLIKQRKNQDSISGCKGWFDELSHKLQEVTNQAWINQAVYGTSCVEISLTKDNKYLMLKVHKDVMK